MVRNPLLGQRFIRKTFSFSAVSNKQFVIKDHYEFDQKVRIWHHAQGRYEMKPVIKLDCVYKHANFYTADVQYTIDAYGCY